MMTFLSLLCFGTLILAGLVSYLILNFADEADHQFHPED